MEPTKKSPGVADFLDKLSDRTNSIQNDRCIPPPFGCGEPVTEFPDELSEREYCISGLCPKCQKRIFEEKNGDVQ